MTTNAVIAGVNLTWAARTDVGRVRAQNQDNTLTEPGLFVVADGMGGHADGAAAATSVVQALRPLAAEVPLTQDRMLAGVEDARRAVTDLPATGSAEPGSTLTALVLSQEGGRVVWLIVNLGDSRTYRLSEGRLTQQTVDHTAAQELFDAQVITAAQARVDPRRNVLTRAIGAGLSQQAQPDVFTVELQTARFLLCSDGLSNEVDDDTLRSVLQDAGDPEAAADRLLELALAAGARDNVTLIVVDAAPHPAQTTDTDPDH